MDRGIGLVLVWVGVGLVVLGVAVRAGALSWFGRLPGDIRVESGGTRVFIPITSMLLVSVVATLLVNLFQRLR